MSYDIKLVDENGRPVEVSSHQEGGIIAPGGNTVAEINITYNYSWFFYQLLDPEEGIRWLYGKRYMHVKQRMEVVIKSLGFLQHSDYWAATPGNVGHVLSVLLGWAEENPEAVFEGD